MSHDDIIDIAEGLLRLSEVSGPTADVPHEDRMTVDAPEAQLLDDNLTDNQTRPEHELRAVRGGMHERADGANAPSVESVEVHDVFGPRATPRLNPLTPQIQPYGMNISPVTPMVSPTASFTSRGYVPPHFVPNFYIPPQSQYFGGFFPPVLASPVSLLHAAPATSAIIYPPPLTPTSIPGISGVEKIFLGGLFDDIGITELSGRRLAGWYNSVSTEARILVILRCIKRVGFDSLGEFLAELLSPRHETHQTVMQTVSSFLHKQSRPGTRPIDIVKLIHEHRKSEIYQNRTPLPVLFPSLPRYARPPSQRVLESVLADGNSSTRGDIMDWALSLVLRRVDEEVDTLLGHKHGFSLHEDVTWDRLLSWNMQEKQELIAKTAPVIFSILTTISVNKRARNKLEEHAQSACASAATPDEDELGNQDTEETAPDDSDPTMRRDPWLGAVTATYMLAHFRYQYATWFPTIMGTILFICGAPAHIFRILSRVGLSVSYYTLLRRLRSLGADSSMRTREWGKAIQNAHPGIMLLYDNVNKLRRAWQQTLGHKDEVQSGTAATIIKLEDVPPGALDLDPFLANIRKKLRLELTVDDLLNDIDWTHIRGVGAGLVLRVWVKYLPPLKSHHPSVEKLFSETHRKHKLRVRKSEIESLQCSNIDESTTAGTAQLLMDIICKQLGIVGSWLDKSIIFICGDQLSVDRVRKLKRYSAKGSTPFKRKDPFLPVIQLWHMKWNWQKAIFRLNWNTTKVESGTFGLYHDCELLGREKFNATKCDFYPAHHILEDRFEALILDALRLLCEKKSGVSYPADMKLLDALPRYFMSDGPLASCSFKMLHEFAEEVYQRYLSNRAHDRCQDAALQPNTSTAGESAPYSTSNPISLTTEPPRNPTWNGDLALANTLVFLRMTFWYLEFSTAVAEGDIGRVHEIIKVLRFSFWGAGSTNYGNELLELACNFLKEFPDPLRIALLNNFLVNPSGLPGHFQELDLLQEHYNYWIKRLYNIKSLDFDSSFLKQCISLNLGGFGHTRERFKSWFGIARAGRSHTDADTTADINLLAQHYRENHILTFRQGRDQSFAVPNEFKLGLAKLAGGQLQTFLQRTTLDVNSDVTDPNNNEEGVANNTDLGEERSWDDPLEPACPIIFGEGIATLEAFIANPEL